MNTHLLALQLMAVQGLLGAFDTIFHHELSEALPQRVTARKELGIHAIRALIYSVLFIGLSTWMWHGAWAVVLLVLFGVETMLTLWDFVVEDKTRLLPATERVTHTILAINGGAFITLLVLNMPDWLQQPTAFVSQPYGWLSGFLALCGIGVGVSGIRDAFAALRTRAISRKNHQLPRLNFSDRTEHILVTGATGFIGQLLVHALLADGHSVTALTRSPKQAAWAFDGKVRCIQSLHELPVETAVDVIINLAGARILGWRWTKKRKQTLMQSRIGTTQAIVDWIATTRTRPRLFLSASAIGFYGIQANGDATSLTEDSPAQPIFMSTLCQEWEATARAAQAHGVQVTCLRFGLVLGHQGALPMMRLPVMLGLGGPLGSGRQWLSWVHVQDLLRGIAHLCQLQRTEEKSLAITYNFTAPQAVSQAEFSQTAARVHSRPCIFPTPGWLMRLLLGEQSDLLLEGQRVLPVNLLKSGFRFDQPNLEAALLDLR